MHTEHMQNVSAGRVLAGWLVAIAVTSLVTFAFMALGLLSDDPATSDTLWSTLAVLIGFLAGGYWSGFRATQAPLLHAAGIGLTSLVAWFVLNVLAQLFLPSFEWPSMTPELAIGLLLAQFLAAGVGALLGYNIATRGRPGLGEHEPVG